MKIKKQVQKLIRHRKTMLNGMDILRILPIQFITSPNGHKVCNVNPGNQLHTVYPKKYAHGFWFAVLCCGYTLTDFPISIRLTSLALWQSNDCPSASKATLMNKDKYFMWIHYERLHNNNKAKHNKTMCIFLGIYCIRTHWLSQAVPVHRVKYAHGFGSSLIWLWLYNQS